MNDPQVEREANYFAMCLLMPEHFVRQEIKEIFKNGIDILEDKNIKKLADKFQVSEQLMIMRLTQLEII